MKFKPAHKRGAVLVELGPEENRVLSPGATTTATVPSLFNLKKILVPVDFCEPSRKAVQYAVGFARQFQAEISLLHVVRLYPIVPEMAPVDIETIQDAKQDLEALKAQVEPLVKCHMLIRTGEPHVEIVVAANELEIDLIVLGTKGRSGLARMVLGATAEKVVRRAACPVLVVREHEHDFVAANAFGLSQTGAITEPALRA